MEEDSRDAVSDGSLSPPPKVRRVGMPKRLWLPENKGDTIFQVFSARFVDYEPVSMPEIYGTFFLQCGSMAFVLFERIPGDPVDSLLIDHKGFLKLIGPSDVHYADDRIEFHAFLTNLKGPLLDLHDTLWYGNPDKRWPCNTLLVKRWDTMIGTVELNYAIFTKSVAASLEVNLLDWKDNGQSYGRIMGPADEIEVFGEITSRVKMLTDAEAKSYMFKREKEMCSRVRPGEAIPLSRSYMVCPIRSSILLRVALYHPNIEGDDFVANADVEVPALKRSDKIVLENDCARIELNINFIGFE